MSTAVSRPECPDEPRRAAVALRDATKAVRLELGQEALPEDRTEPRMRGLADHDVPSAAVLRREGFRIHRRGST